MITFTIQHGKKSVKKQIPTCWEDLTFQQYVDLLTFKGDDVDMISMFTGVEREQLLKGKIKGLEPLLLALEFLQSEPGFKAPTLFMGHHVPDITFHSLGPYVDCRHIVSKMPAKDITEFVKSYAELCAIYVQSLREEYDNEKAMKLIPEIYNQPAWEVVGLGSFFITKFVPLKKNTQSNSPQTEPLQKKKKRVTGS